MKLVNRSPGNDRRICRQPFSGGDERQRAVRKNTRSGGRFSNDGLGRRI